MTTFWDVTPCSLVEVYRSFIGACCLHHQALMMEAVSTSETSVNFYQTTRGNIPEDSHLHTHRHQNLKSHQVRLKLREK
jgi:glycyl-tRNA synthetase alpha subunit